MGKNIVQQARGHGGPTYRAPSHRYKGAAKHLAKKDETVTGRIVDIIKCPGHTSPLAQVEYSTGETALLIAPEGVKVGAEVQTGPEAVPAPGNTLPLSKIPEGTLVYNIEAVPGDGGKFVRASGVFAKVVMNLKDRIIVQLPSKKQKEFHPQCRASIGVIAGGGRTEKPFYKAGNKYKAMKARNKYYPVVSGNAMNAVDHPFGNKRSQRKSKARPTSRNAPPGRKVGMVGARRTGRKKGKQA
ncbi:50S ribosomal protein L2 [Candidatus Woesearchaeota archaeon]|nr:MAG: 50S ribosomal protein L2 [Candidatus Woesearchaeota archaeon]